jgi:hypothetical protein
MAKIIGYILALIGLAIIAFSSKIVTIPFVAAMPKGMIYTIIAGVAFVAVGVVLVLAKEPSSGKAPQHAKEEVPIYTGEGKKRKIVGYRKD